MGVVSTAGRLVGPMARFVTRGGLRVLMYHRFSLEPDARKVDAETFRSHLGYIREHFNPVSAGDVLDAIRTGKALPPKSVLVTVDDGYRDFIEVAYPILGEYRIPSCLFVLSAGMQGRSWLWFDQLRHAIFGATVTRFELEIDGERREFPLQNPALREAAWDAIATRCSRLTTERREQVIADVASCVAMSIPDAAPQAYALASVTELRALDAQAVEIGAHTATHPILSQCTDAEIETEIVHSKLEFERLLEREMRIFCYPSGMPGDFDRRATNAVKRAGYGAATTANGGMCTAEQLAESPWLIPRISAGMALEQLKNEINGATYLRGRVA